MGEMPMQVSTIKAYDEYGYEVMDFKLPTMDEASIAANEFGKALANFGMNARDAAEAIARISEALARIDVVESVLDYKIDSRVASLETKVNIMQNSASSNENRIYALEQEIVDLRPALDATTENPNQKGDLEIFSQIVWDENFLKLLNEPIEIDL
jgi:hypothetical protein